MSTPEEVIKTNPNPGTNLSGGPVAKQMESFLAPLKTKKARMLIQKIFSVDQQSFDRIRAVQNAPSTKMADLRKRICSAIFSLSSSVADYMRQSVDKKFSIGQSEGDMRKFINAKRQDLENCILFGVSPHSLDTILFEEAEAQIENRLGNQVDLRKKILAALFQHRNEFFPNAIVPVKMEREEIKENNPYEKADEQFLVWINGLSIAFGGSWGLFAGSRGITMRTMGALADNSVLNRKIEEAAKLREIMKATLLDKSQKDRRDLINHWKKWVEDNIPSLIKESPERRVTNSPEVDENTTEAVKVVIKQMIDEAAALAEQK